MISMLLAIALHNVQDQPVETIYPIQPTTRPNNWVSDSDYPAEADSKGYFGMVRFKLDVDAAGLPSSCHILNTSGYWLLDERACELLLARAKFKPAHRADGTGVPASFISSFWWSHAQADRDDWVKLIKQVTDPVSSVVFVKKLPANYKEPPLVRVHFGEMGKPIECRVELTSGNTAIDKISCQQAQADAVLPEFVHVRPGKPDTRMYVIAFSADAPPEEARPK